VTDRLADSVYVTCSASVYYNLLFVKILSGNKPCQFWTEALCFGDLVRLHQGNDLRLTAIWCLYTRLMPPLVWLLANGEWRPSTSQNHSFGIIARELQVQATHSVLSGKFSLSSFFTRIPYPPPWWHTPPASVLSLCWLTWHLSIFCSVSTRTHPIGVLLNLMEHVYERVPCLAQHESAIPVKIVGM
jgi:hypothetical protein